MHNISKIALLKLIRENQPISLNEIAVMIENSKELKTSPYRHLLDNIRGYPRHSVDDLFKLKVIVTQDDIDFTPDIKLMSSHTLPHLQELLRFSLTRLIEEGENPIQITPIFKQPRPNRPETDIFVAMPFQDDLKQLYTDHILKVTTQLQISCKRGDDFFTANRIMDDIWSAIYYAKLCIVDCTGRNPNVFYELGIAHTLGRKAILITQNINDVPFDVQDWRTITYEFTPHGMDIFEQNLKKTIQQELGLDK